MLTLRTIRYGGAAGAGLLVLAGWLGGALPDGEPRPTPISVFRGEYGPVILGSWLIGTAILGYAWWAARDRVPSTRWALGTITLWAVPFLVVPPTGSRDGYSYACQGHLFVNGLSPYEFGVSTLPCPWVEAVSPIWRDTPAPYGPLFVLIAAGAVLLGGKLTGVILLLRLAALAGLVVVARCLPVLARRCGVPESRAMWVALAGPLVGLHLIGGPHNDALMIAAVVAGLTLLARQSGPGLSPVAGADPSSRGTPRRCFAPGYRSGVPLQVVAGGLLGLAAAVKIIAIVVIPFAVLLAVAPAPLISWAAVRAAARILGAAVVGMAGVTVATGLGLGWLAGLSHTQDLVQFTSPPTAVGMTTTYVGRLLLPEFDAVPAVRMIALLILALVLVLFWVRSAATKEQDPVPVILRGAALAAASVILFAPSFHPWYAMYPLILFAATTVRTDLVMAATIATSFLVLPDGGGLARFVKFPGAPLMTILLIVLISRRIPRRVPTSDSGFR